MALNFEKKLFYSYNSPWLHQSSLSYSQNYTYSVIFNKKNHKIIQNGTEYGTFHNSNYISCLPSDAFINETNTFTLNPINENFFCVKVPAQASNWNSGDISFDVTLSSEFGSAKYTISGKLGSGQGSSNKTWIARRAICVSNQIKSNNLNNLDVRFINYRCRVVGSTHCYWPMIAIGPTTVGNSAALPTTINISNISTSLNLNSSNLSYNFIDTSANLDHKWEVSLKTSLDATYYVQETIANTLVQAHSANQAGFANVAQFATQLTNSVNIWGQSFNGSEDIAGNFTLNSTNYWQKFQTGSDNSSYLLRTAYLRVNSNNTTRDSLTNMNFAFDVDGDSRFSGYVGIGWQPQKMYNKPVRLYITGDENLTRIHPSETNRFYSLVTEYGLHYLGDPVGIGAHPVLDDNTAGGTDGRGAMLTVRSTYPEDNRNPISIYSAGGDNILKGGDTSIGINTYLGSPKRRLFIDGGSSNNYAIYSQNGQNYFNERVGIGIEPNNTSYMLNVNGRIWAKNGINVYGQGSMLNATQNAAININNISSASWDQVIKVFCLNSNQNGNVYTYWHCGIYTMKNSDRKWAYDTEASTAYNLLLYTADTTTNGPQCLYAFNTNPDYKGTVALNEGTIYNLVCLGVIKLYRSQVNSPWEAVRIAGNLNPSTIVQPTSSTTEPTSSTVGTSGVKITFTLSSTKHISRSTIKICSAIPVINSIFFNNRQVPVAQIALNSGVNIANNIIQMYAHTSTATSVNTSAITDGIIVWGTSYDIRVQNALSNVMTSTGNGYPSSIRVTLFGYYS